MMRVITAIVGICFCVVSGLAAEEWTQFRGLGSRGISQAKGLPMEWGEGKNILWQTAIHGKAWASPVVLDGQVWMSTASKDGRQLSAICVDLESGKIIHDLKLFDVENPQFAHDFNSYGSPTPTIEKGRVYVTFGSPGTACLDVKTGRKIWERRDFVCNHFRGAGSSPVIVGNLILMNFDGSDYQFVVALDKNTGNTVWKTDRSLDYQDLTPQGKPQADGDFRKAFSTPAIADFGRGLEMISLGSKATYGYDVASGKELWRVEHRGQHSGSATPVVGEGLIFISTGFGRAELWAIKAGRSGVLGESDVAWKLKRNAPNKPSPILVDGLLYIVDDGGIASCLEAKTGTEVWKNRVKGNYSASPLYAEGKVYYFSG